jgi:membrane protein implicated in regulation of membrane protease activity
MGRVGIRILIFSVLFMFLLISTFSSFVFAQDTPPNEGNWTVNGEISIKGKEIVLNGDLIVQDRGELSLTNVDLKFNCNEDGEYKIKVENGGRLEIYNSKISSNTNYIYEIDVDDGGTFNIHNSTLVDYATYDLFSVEEEILFLSLIATIVILIVLIILITLFYHTSKKKRKIMTTTIESLVGKEGVVQKTVKPNNYSGNVKVESQIWSATAKNRLIKNEKVLVVGVKGINLIVEKSKE